MEAKNEVMENQESWWSNSVWVQRLENQRSPKCKSQFKDGCPSSSRWQIHPSSTFLFYSDTPQLEDAHLHWWGRSLLILLIQRQFLPETFSQICPEVMFNQLSGHSLAQSSWYIKLTIPAGVYSADGGTRYKGWRWRVDCVWGTERDAIWLQYWE